MKNIFDHQMSLQKRLFSLLRDADQLWQQRKRKITTASILSTLASCSVRNRGIEHILQEQEKGFSQQALSYARAKLPENLFRNMNITLQVKGLRKEPKIFAIDGSKVHIHPSFVKEGYKPRTNDVPVPRPAKRPIAMLSSMVDVKTKTCYDSIVTKHFNERKAAKILFESTIKGDTVIFDRGYYSKDLVIDASKAGLNVLFRLKRTAFKSARTFFNSIMTDTRVLLRSEDGFIAKCRLVKYFIDGKKYMCLTNMQNTRKEIKELYAKRWTVETSFRRLKTDLNLEVAHSMTSQKYIQEIQARILLDTFAMLSQENTNEQKLCDKKRDKTKGYHYFVDGFVAFSHHMCEFFEDNMHEEKKYHLYFSSFKNQ
jgi:hypothetical protein